LDLVAIGMAIVAAIAVFVVVRGLDGGVSSDLVALLVFACGLAATPIPAWVTLPISAGALAFAITLLVRRKKTFHAMRPKQSTAIFACGLAVAVLLLAQGWNARVDRTFSRTHVPPGGHLMTGNERATFDGPRREGSRCALTARSNVGMRALPVSTSGGGCNGVAVAIFPTAAVVRDDDGMTTTYELPSLERVRVTPYQLSDELQLFAFVGLLLSVVGMIRIVRRARMQDAAGPYRGAAMEVTVVTDFGVPPAATAALACMAPLAFTLVARLVGY
jgi:hypothetical protein